MLETKDGRHSPLMRLLHWVTLGCLCLGAIAVSALRAPAEDGEAESAAPARVARKEPAKSIDRNTGSTAQGASTSNGELPPLPRSVIYKVTTESGDVPPQTVKVMMLGPDRTRQESLGEVIAVSNQRTSIWLNSRDKKATIIEYPENEDEHEELGLFGGYRKLLTDPRYMPEVKRDVLGEGEIDGRPVVGHRLTYHRAIVTIWVDPISLLPVQIERVIRMYPNMKTIQTDFVYNVDLDESLFSVEPPAGYTVHRRRATSGPYEEEDLIETLREYRQQRQSTFPDTLDGNGDRDLVRKKSQALGDDPTPEQREEHREWLAKVSRGRWFADRLPPEADAHYAGKGVKVDATDTPIFWYRPEGKGRYRVIRADLSVVKTGTPPEIPGARAINDWGKEERALKRPWRNRTAAYNVQNLAPLVRQMGIVPFSLRNELKVRVLPGSAAEKAGIRTGDRITALSGLNVKRVEDVAALWALWPFYAKTGGRRVKKLLAPRRSRRRGSTRLAAAGPADRD
ncbi:MAG: PDZ domain-containing protein [Planctomycetota bacterium]